MDRIFREAYYVFREAYYEGGKRETRYLADIEILIALVARRRPLMGFALFILARIFGAPFWPHRFRWGRRLPYLQSLTYRQQRKIIRDRNLPRGQEKDLLRKYGLMPPRIAVPETASGNQGDAAYPGNGQGRARLSPPPDGRPEKGTDRRTNPAGQPHGPFAGRHDRQAGI